MDFLARTLGSELFMSLALVVVPWGIARAFAWWRAESERRGDAEYARAVEALEVGVDEAWEKFGREWKHARADGKLSEEERGDLRTLAREVAVEVGRDEGLDVLKILGARALKLVIGKIVERRKRAA